MIDHETSKVQLSSALTKMLSVEDLDRLQDQFVRARPFLKHLAKVVEAEIERTVKAEETAASVENPYRIVNIIGKRSGLRYFLDLIKNK